MLLRGSFHAFQRAICDEEEINAERILWGMVFNDRKSLISKFCREFFAANFSHLIRQRKNSAWTLSHPNGIFFGNK